MPPKRNQNRSKTKNKRPQASKEPAVDAMGNCVFPRDIMLCILTRLPVKSLLRFKSVCKPWCKLFATPKFMKMHHDQFSDDPRNQTFIIYSLSAYHDHTMSLLNVECNKMKLKPRNLDHPYPEVLFRMDFVGCCNGLVCMGCPPLGQGIVLWNPTTKLSKFIRLSRVDFGSPDKVSLGFGYDSERSDFKVVRVVCLGKTKKGKNMGVGVEVYSANSDSWKTIKVDFQFRVLWTNSDVIVNGNPYWVAKVDENESSKNQLGEVLVWFDVTKLVFKIVPLSSLDLKEGAQVPLVDWKGSLGAILSNKNMERVESIDVWVFDDGQKIWTKNHTFGPIEMNVDRFVQCSKNGKKIVGQFRDGKLFVFDPETGLVKKIVIDEAQSYSFWVCGYSESLAYVKGMQQVVVKKEEKDEDEEEDDMEGALVDVDGFVNSCMQLRGYYIVNNYPFRGIID
ncbi:hypothetical protein CDL12_11834 [Handroanthus impetiginosus]|uniref:F-box domain-containing protein n=1 Tax=Handroanthus impetiginosus TaxID=429701 RepID=A0A2G9HE05_9LAMI|nr:hypothetical protein CDL12_11834 [Handroanthus impetiginosus]